MLIGGDIGFGQVKATDGHMHRKFASVVASPSVFQLADERTLKGDVVEHMTVETGGRRYVVGPAALLHDTASISLDPDKADDEHDFAKLLAMYGLFAEDAETTYTLLTGLPVFEFTEEARAKVLRRWGGRHEFTFCGRRYIASVPVVKIVPQAAGAFYSAALNENGELVRYGEEDVLVLDIGYRTSDAITMCSTRYASDMSGTIWTGMGKLHSEIRKRIHQEFRFAPSLAKMDAIVRQGSITVSGCEHYIGHHVAKVGRTMVDQIFAELAMYVDDLRRVNRLLLAGGGASFLADIIREKVGSKVQVELLPDAEYSNAEGYYRYGRLQARHGKL